MDVFWNTIAAYNAATWPVQLLLVVVAAVLTLLLYLRPTRAVRVAMKVFMAALNFWIAGVYYFLYCAPREHYDILALFWTVMGCIGSMIWRPDTSRSGARDDTPSLLWRCSVCRSFIRFSRWPWGVLFR